MAAEKRTTKTRPTETYQLTEADLPMRPEVGTGAPEILEKALKGDDCEEPVWDHLGWTVRARFVASEHGQLAVKVLDQRGNELLVVKRVEGKP